MGNETQTDPVVVATAGTLQQADVMRAALEAAGIPVFIPHELSSNWMAHWGVAVNRRGIEIAVPQKHLAQARAVLNLPAADQPAPKKAPKEHLTPDDYAEKAFRAALYWCWFPPIALLMAYYFLRALIGRTMEPVQQPDRYARHLVLAFVMGIVLPGIFVLIVLETTLGGISQWLSSGAWPFSWP